MTATPRESSEWRAIRVELNGEAVTTGVQVCIVVRGARPTAWQAATIRDGKTCVRVANLTQGYYDVYGRGTAGDEQGVVGPFPLTIG